jgi:hypothetical protein
VVTIIAKIVENLSVVTKIEKIVENLSVVTKIEKIVENLRVVTKIAEVGVNDFALDHRHTCTLFQSDGHQSDGDQHKLSVAFLLLLVYVMAKRGIM